MANRCLLALAVVVLYACPAPAQTRAQGEVGFPFVTNYHPREYQGGAQIWCALQDDRGLMYFCDRDGILEFDGSNWRLIENRKNVTARSLVLHTDGLIYAGFVGDLGRLAADAAGTLRYESLLDFVPLEHRHVTDVWQILSTPDGVYFRTNSQFLRWDGERMRVLRATESYHHSEYVHNALYVREWQIGLQRMEGDSLVLVPGGERFAQERIYAMLPFDDRRILLATRTQGLLLFDGRDYEPFVTEADDYLRANNVYLPGALLDDGTIALGTIVGGVVHLDRSGRLIRRLDKAAGLNNQSVYYVMQDRAGDLWLATEQGISRVEIRSPFTIFDARTGLTSQPYEINRSGGQIYVGRVGGFSRLDPTTGTFRSLPDVPDQVFDLLPLKHGLLGAGASSGVYGVRGDRVELVVGAADNSYQSWELEPAAWDDDIVFVGLREGLSAIERIDDGSWKEISRLSFAGNVGSISQVRPGQLWVGLRSGGASLVSYPLKDGRPLLHESNSRFFGADDGLSDAQVTVSNVGGQTYFVTSDSILVFDANSQKFVRDDRFLFDSFRGTGYLQEMPSGEIWVVLGDKSALARPRGDGTYGWERAPFVRLDDAQVRDLFPEPDGVAWFAGVDGIVRYDPGQRRPQPVLTTLIREVRTGVDSVLFGGLTTAGGVTPRLSHQDNQLRFQYALTNFVEADRNVFRTQLDGFDLDWSPWQPTTERSYTNLPAGDYVFRVQARTVEGQEGPEANYAFAILPPWHQTIWAYLVYVLGAVTMVASFVRVRTRHLESRQRDLERTVEQRTAEVRELLAQSDQRAAELGTVNEISKALVSQLEFDALVQLVGDLIQKTFRADIAYVALVDEARRMISFPYGYGEEFQSFPFGKGLTSQIIDTGEALLINENVSGTYEQIGREEVGDQVASYLGVPIYEGAKVVGVVSVQSKHEEGRFGESDLRLLTTIAANVGIALQNAESYRKLTETLHHLKETQEQLVTQEKMASLGQLTAGIAHEIKNPLNFVNNFADLVTEMAKELDEELSARETLRVKEAMEELSDILQGLKINAAQIQKHGKRADSIVRNMMQHASGASSERYPIEINAFVDEYIGLAYHGMRAADAELEVAIIRDFDAQAGNVVMTPQDMGRVLVNLLNNALYAVHHHRKAAGPGFVPSVTVRTRRNASSVEITVTDNGPGIPPEIRDRIFQPLFTTKPAGSGTGLGLSLSFEIVTNGHNGRLEVETKEGRGASFIVTLPA